MSVDPADVEAWKGAIGNETIEYQLLPTAQLRRFAQAAGVTDDTAMPPLPHWAFFLPAPSDSDIGVDGHPRRGGFLPAVSLPRRMFAAADIRFETPLETGLEARLDSVVADVTHKSGRSGDLVFVEVDRTLSQDGVVRVRERQSYVYRSDGGTVEMPEPLTQAPDGERWWPSEVNLFRFSAATANGHRIHYDHPYATKVEGYPALVIHGPFTAVKLAALAGRRGALASFAFRAQAPLFLGQPVYLQRTNDDEVRAVRCDGATAMTAKVSYR